MVIDAYYENRTFLLRFKRSELSPKAILLNKVIRFELALLELIKDRCYSLMLELRVQEDAY